MSTETPSAGVEVVDGREVPTDALVAAGKETTRALADRRRAYLLERRQQGVSFAEIARELEINQAAINGWIKTNKEFRDDLLHMKTLMTMKLIPEAVKTLEDGMGAQDGETRRKAANDILDHAEGRRSREVGVTINADNVLFANMSTTKLANLARELGVGAEEPEPVDASKPKEAGEPEEPKVPDPPPAPKPLPPVVLPAVPPADPPKTNE